MPDGTTTETIDARGLNCPQPSDLAFQAIVKRRVTRLTIQLDDPASREQLERLAAQFGYSVECRRERDYDELTLTKR
jgi:TusA-related sulfurtransferase